MIAKRYDIIIDNRKIGTTELENADPPMGVVFGNIIFDSIVSGYDFLKTYSLNNNMEIIADYPDEKFITTSIIPSLKVIDQNGMEIIGQGTNIEGMDGDVFQLTIYGIAYPFFEEEFPHHRQAYDNQFNDRD